MFKILFPIVWISGWWTALLLAVIVGAEVEPFLLVAGAGGTAVLGYLAWRLKTVEIDEHYVYVRGLRTEITLPLADVISVHQSLLSNIRPVFIVFRQATPFGKSVMFMARRTGNLFREDDIVAIIRQRAGLS